MLKQTVKIFTATLFLLIITNFAYAQQHIGDVLDNITFEGQVEGTEVPKEIVLTETRVAWNPKSTVNIQFSSQNVNTLTSQFSYDLIIYPSSEIEGSYSNESSRGSGGLAVDYYTYRPFEDHTVKDSGNSQERYDNRHALYGNRYKIAGSDIRFKIQNSLHDINDIKTIAIGSFHHELYFANPEAVAFYTLQTLYNELKNVKSETPIKITIAIGSDPNVKKAFENELKLRKAMTTKTSTVKFTFETSPERAKEILFFTNLWDALLKSKNSKLRMDFANASELMKEILKYQAGDFYSIGPSYIFSTIKYWIKKAFKNGSPDMEAIKAGIQKAAEKKYQSEANKEAKVGEAVKEIMAQLEAKKGMSRLPIINEALKVDPSFDVLKRAVEFSVKR